MRKFTIFASFALGFLLSGCLSAKVNISKTEIKYDSSMTSKEIEKKMNWKYCEESN